MLFGEVVAADRWSFRPWRAACRAPRGKAGARPALAGIITSLPYVRAKASAIWLRQEFPMQTKSTRFVRQQSQFLQK